MIDHSMDDESMVEIWLSPPMVEASERSVVSVVEVRGDSIVIIVNYGYRIDKVKHNLQIEVNNPSIDWGICNFVVFQLAAKPHFHLR